ncbi:MAG TPA: succinate dehydrogenase assembly factor 2 [Alphaproteobacteria bacterium]|jgi:antitoxin CptB|nr:succinate dehydrogenase assembly factor 2 [Alphaproteobacteria bacterium]
MAEDLETKRKRLLYRSWHRGTKELDLILGKFAEQHLADFSPGELVQYEAILESDEHDIYAWLAGRQEVPAEHRNPVVQRILDYRVSDKIR